MTSIDELFKASGVGSKRKLEPLQDPNEIYKAARLSHNGHGSRHARNEDKSAPDDNDIEAGPEPPPDNDEGEYGPAASFEDTGEDDEEGRFFGGGISKQEDEVLDYVESNESAAAAAAPEKIDEAWLRKFALNFERCINRNLEQRAKYAVEPQRFIASEADLDAEIKALGILTEHPVLYAEFVRLGCAASLVGLLAHENSDVAIDAVEIIQELTDDDTVASEAQWGTLVEAFVEADLVGLLLSNLERLDESNELDRNGVYYCLGVIENICEDSKTLELVGGQEKLLKWLLKRIQAKENPAGQNKQYAAEVLAILARSNHVKLKLASLDAVDVMLQLVAAYRRRDPEKGSEEEEYMENLFEVLASLTQVPEGKAKFVEAEGVELCLIMLKEGKLSRAGALRLLAHAAAGAAGAEVCVKTVEAGGLKNIFTLFMRNKTDGQTAKRLIWLFASQLRLLPADSPERIRTLAKFVERDYEKIARLVALRREYAARLDAADSAIRAERARIKLHQTDLEDMETEWFARRCDAGLVDLRRLDVVLAWLVAEDGGARRAIQKLLADRDETLDAVRATIQEEIDGMDRPLSEEDKEVEPMLSALVGFLRQQQA
ncbi:Catenin-beta-like protein [Xylariaceae sp. FL0662B]|nr:Catenin-beta-like protein [Xylariaceae sp. FL0662B]